MRQWAKKLRKAFTLVEIMIVIAIVGVLVAIAIPNYMKARKTARAKMCQENLAKITGAVDQWAFENNKSQGESGPEMTVLVGPEKFLKRTAYCPIGNTPYEVPNVGQDAVCPNVAEHPLHKLP